MNDLNLRWSLSYFYSEALSRPKASIEVMIKNVNEIKFYHISQKIKLMTSLSQWNGFYF